MRILLQVVFTAVFLFNFELHPVHVSIAEMKYNATNRQLETSIKIFRDDLNAIIRTNTGINLNLDDANPKKQSDSLLKLFIDQNLQVEFNSKKAALNYIGYNFEQEAIWIHVFWKTPDRVRLLGITNKILIREFSDQLNLVNLDWKGTKTSFAFKKGIETQLKVLN